MSFTEQTWQRHLPLYEAIRDMPFNRALADGSLAPERFRHYMLQDAHYLVAYGRALALAAAKADHPDAIVQFAEGAREAVVVERSLHEGFMRRFGIDAATFAATPLSPACHHYTSYLQSVAWGAPYPVLLAALLPCFWIYAELGRHTLANCAADNPYRDWIDTYAGEPFNSAVRAVIATIDRVAGGVDPATREQMHQAYATAARLEWMFWDSAWRLEKWPL